MEATYIKVDQSEGGLGEVVLIPNHHPLSIPTLVSPEDWGSPSNTAGNPCTWHSWACELTVFLNEYALHSVQNHSFATGFTFGYSTSFVSIDRVPIGCSWRMVHDLPSSELLVCLLKMQIPGRHPRPTDSEPLGTTSHPVQHPPALHTLLTHPWVRDLPQGSRQNSHQKHSASPEPTRQLKIEPGGDENLRPGVCGSRGTTAECPLRWQHSFSSLDTQWQAFSFKYRV